MGGRGGWCRGIGRGWRPFFVVVVRFAVFLVGWGEEWMLLNMQLGGKERGSRGDSSCGSVVDSHG